MTAFQLAADIQGLKTRYSYESSKRLVDLICLAHMRHEYTIPMYSTSPGCVPSNILNGYLPVWIHWCLLFFIRVAFGISQVNLGDNCVAAMMYLIKASSEAENQVPREIKFCSESTRLGSSLVTLEELKESTVGEADRAYEYCEKLLDVMKV